MSEPVSMRCIVRAALTGLASDADELRAAVNGITWRRVYPWSRKIVAGGRTCWALLFVIENARRCGQHPANHQGDQYTEAGNSF